MMYYRNFCSLLLIFLFGISLIGCGAEVPSKPGEEVVSDKWSDPKDKSSISILPYTEMKEITLPVTLHDGRT